MIIYTDFPITEHRRGHAVVDHDEQSHRWGNSIVECLQYARDLGHTEVTLSDDHGSFQIILKSLGDPVP